MFVSATLPTLTKINPKSGSPHNIVKNGKLALHLPPRFSSISISS